MEIAKESKVLGIVPEKTLALLNENINKMNQLTFKVGNLEVAKSRMLKEIEDIQYSQKVEEQKIIKKYGENAKLNIKTGEITD